MRRVLKWAGLSAVALVLVLVVSASVLWARARGARSEYQGDQLAAGLSAPVRIVRDAHAVPHVFGETDDDVLFALGYAHAQDRFWQMDLSRRQTQGRLSEIFGRPALAGDEFARSRGFAANVEWTWRVMPEADKRSLGAYSAGVNTYLGSTAFRLPAEYVLTLTKPDPWKATDSLFVWKTLWLQITGNLGEEYTRAVLQRHTDPRFAKDFLRPYPRDGHVALAWSDLARTLGLPAAPSVPGRAGAAAADMVARPQGQSNNWVVSGRRSASGAPLLANDPHLPVSMPPVWYLAHLQFPDGPTVGATLPGVPGVIVGRNAALAWGATANLADVEDFYLEPLDPNDATRYRTPDGWREFEKRIEVFRVRFASPVTRTYLVSRHGPVTGPDESTELMIDHAKHAIAISSTATDGPDLSVAAFHAVNKARTVEAFVEALRRFDGPPVNIVFAHRDGTVGFLAAGRTPLRSREHETGGQAPADGSKAVNDWLGYVAFAHLPRVLDPQSGAIATANARITPPEYPYFRTSDEGDPSRQQRIQDLLDARPRHDLASFQAIQADVVAPLARRLVQLLETTKPVRPVDAEALELLRGWDGGWRASESAPVVYAAWTAALSKAIYADELGPVFDRFWWYDAYRLTDVLSGELAYWCDDRTTPRAESCAELQASALSTAVDDLVERYGPMACWRWGELFVGRHPHMGLADFPVVGARLSRFTPREGGPGAPNVGYFDVRRLPDLGHDGEAPSLRMIFDLANLEDGVFVTSGGQSGHFASPHYDDLQKLWLRGEYIRIPTIESALGVTQVLTLRPPSAPSPANAGSVE
jgi:penicillin amidase